MRRGVPLFSPDSTRRLNNPAYAFREHPDFYAPDLPEDPEVEDYMTWLESLPEAWKDAA